MITIIFYTYSERRVLDPAHKSDGKNVIKLNEMSLQWYNIKSNYVSLRGSRSNRNRSKARDLYAHVQKTYIPSIVHDIYVTYNVIKYPLHIYVLVYIEAS